MYSEALRILDANTVQYMVEEQKKEILELTEALEDSSRALEEERKARLEKDKEIMYLRALLKATKDI